MTAVYEAGRLANADPYSQISLGKGARLLSRCGDGLPGGMLRTQDGIASRARHETRCKKHGMHQLHIKHYPSHKTMMPNVE
jgi:hypothetical protein